VGSAGHWAHSKNIGSFQSDKKRSSFSERLKNVAFSEMQCFHRVFTEIFLKTSANVLRSERHAWVNPSLHCDVTSQTVCLCEGCWLHPGSPEPRLGLWKTLLALAACILHDIFASLLRKQCIYQSHFFSSVIKLTPHTSLETCDSTRRKYSNIVVAVCESTPSQLL